MASLTEYEQLTIADSLIEEHYSDGDVMVTQGEPGNKFYIVKEVRYIVGVMKIRPFAIQYEKKIFP